MPRTSTKIEEPAITDTQEPVTADLLSPVLGALVKAKSNFGSIIKDRTNPFHKSKYATLDSINKAVDAALLSEGLVIVNAIEKIEGKQYLVSRLLHSSGEFDPLYQESLCPLPDVTDSQKLGSAITYARRYNKICLLDVVADEDDDGNASTTITKPQVSSLVGLTKKHGWKPEEVTELLKSYGFSKSSQLTLSAYKDICAEIEKRPIEIKQEK